MEQLFLIKRHFNVSSLKDEQKETAAHLLRSKDVVAILPTGKKCHMSTWLNSKEVQNGTNVVVVIAS